MKNKQTQIIVRLAAGGVGSLMMFLAMQVDYSQGTAAYCLGCWFATLGAVNLLVALLFKH